MTGRHSERDLYVVWVLWLIGLSEQSIALAVMKRPKQVAGIVARSPYCNRSAMTDEKRKVELDQLLSIRHGDDGRKIDRGFLDRVKLEIIPLRASQRKASQ